jgi:Tfp pilus assembly protein PilF
MIASALRTISIQIAVTVIALYASVVAVAQTPPGKGAASPVTNATVEAGSLHAQGKAYFDKREYAKAIELYSKAITMSPAYADVWYDRGLAHLGKADFQLAATDFTKAIELFGKAGSNRQLANAYIDRARVLTRLDKTVDALADFERARQFLTNSPQLFAHRAVTHWRAKKFDDAIADTGRVLVLDANSQAGYLARGVRGLVLAERKQYAAAATEFRDLLKAVPDQRTAVAVLRSNLMLGRGDQAMTVRLVRSADPACEPECVEWIAMQGVIERGTDSQLTQVLDRLGDKRLPILIDSPGGNVEAALAMGRKIRERDLDVVTARTEFAPACGTDPTCNTRLKGGRVLGTPSDVASLCSSSCVYILAAGAHRHVGPMSLVGVHQIAFYKIYKEPPSEEQLRKDRLEGRVVVTTPSGPRLLGAVKDAAYMQTRTFYQDMDIDESIMGYLLAAPANGMHWFTTEELVSTRLMTGTGFVGQFLGGAGLTPSVVTLAAPKTSPPASSSTELTEGLNRELLRVGCLTAGRDNTASPATIKRGLARYAALTGRTFGDGPSQAALDALRRHSGTVCPEICPRGTSERDGYCVKPPGAK